MSTTWSRPRPVGSSTSTVVSCVMVKTKTRSKKSSSVETRTASSRAVASAASTRSIVAGAVRRPSRLAPGLALGVALAHCVGVEVARPDEQRRRGGEPEQPSDHPAAPRAGNRGLLPVDFFLGAEYLAAPQVGAGW